MEAISLFFALFAIIPFIMFIVLCINIGNIRTDTKWIKRYYQEKAKKDGMIKGE